MAAFSSELIIPDGILRESRKRKRNKIQKPKKRWDSEVEQQIYMSKFVKALRDQKNNNSADAVREASYRALAISARGTTRWSRAILNNHTKNHLTSGMMMMKKKRKMNRRVVNVNAFRQRQQVNVLGRLVPGCRRLCLPVVLEEARDYIGALEMQVRAMSALANLLSR